MMLQDYSVKAQLHVPMLQRIVHTKQPILIAVMNLRPCEPFELPLTDTFCLTTD